MYGSYDAFAPQQQAPAGVSVPPAAPPGYGAYGSSASVPSFSAASCFASTGDEDALGWLQRDAAASGPRLPQAIRHLQGSVPLWQLLPCFATQADETDDGGIGGGDGSSGGGRVRSLLRASCVRVSGGGYGGFASDAGPAQPLFLEPRMHAGDLLELFGKSQSGKTEMLYQAMLTTLLPKSLSSVHWESVALPLGGCDHGAVLIDCDGRFNALRFEQLLQARIRTALARQWRGKARAMAAEAMGALDDQAEALVAAQGEQALQAYFAASDDYAALRTHCLANLLIFRPQSPRALLGVLLQIDQACAAYNNPTWASKHKTIEATGAASIGQHDESQRMDMGDFSNPHLSAAATAAANAAASARAATYESAPRIALLCIDNVAAFHQLVKGQPPGSTGIGSGAHTPERIAVTTGLSDAHGAAASSSANDRNRTWLYELFARQLKATMQTRQLMCIATKPPLTRKAAEGIQTHFEHEEFLDLHWNRLVVLRIIVREQVEMTPSKPRNVNAGDGVVAPPSGRGVLHGALLKDVMAASKNSAGSTMEFVFRIGSAGVQPNPL